MSAAWQVPQLTSNTVLQQLLTAPLDRSFTPLPPIPPPRARFPHAILQVFTEINRQVPLFSTHKWPAAPCATRVSAMARECNKNRPIPRSPMVRDHLRHGRSHGPLEYLLHSFYRNSQAGMATPSPRWRVPVPGCPRGVIRPNRPVTRS
jgi:hypothetical protein